MTDALAIADKAAKYGLYVNGLEYVDSDDEQRCWVDLDTADERDVETIERYVRHLADRGMLERHSENPNWVRVK